MEWHVLVNHELNQPIVNYNDQLSPTNPRDALHHGERAANK